MAESGALTLEDLGERRFSFYPAILNIEHNEWTLKRLVWSEILVANAKSAEELWIPRRLVGEISSVEEPVVIIGLRKELEYRAGSVWPRERRLLSMSKMGGRMLSPEGYQATKPLLLGHGPALGAEAEVGRLIGGMVLAAVALIIAVVAVTQRPVSYRGREQLALQLGAEDSYNSIVRKLGAPSEDHWRPDTGGDLQFRAMRFEGETYTPILMGTDRDSARYIGAVDQSWKPIHSVSLAGGGDTLALLQRVPKF